MQKKRHLSTQDKNIIHQMVVGKILIASSSDEAKDQDTTPKTAKVTMGSRPFNSPKQVTAKKKRFVLMELEINILRTKFKPFGRERPRRWKIEEFK
jgi:hypothetical protein